MPVMNNKFLAASLCALAIAGLAGQASAQNVLTTHRLSAALASEAVTEAVATCAKQGYKVTAAIIDTDGVDQAVLRGDGAMMTTLDASRDKAYTALMLGADGVVQHGPAPRPLEWFEVTLTRDGQLRVNKDQVVPAAYRLMVS